jgi:PAS domain-containing protein
MGTWPAEAQAYLQSIVDTVREPFLVLDADLRVVSANRAFYQTFSVSPEETENQSIFSLGSGQWDIPDLRRLLFEILPRDAQFEGFEMDHAFPVIGRRALLLNARRLYQPGDHAERILLGIEDVTVRREAETRLQSAYERERRIADALQRPLTLEIAQDAFPGLSVATLYEAAAAGYRT